MDLECWFKKQWACWEPPTELMMKGQRKTRVTIKRTRPIKRTSTPTGRPAGGANKTSGFEKVFARIYRLVLKIPKGRVMTYGQIARLLEDRYSPRLVGWAMHATPHDSRNIPWHRVINSRGTTSTDRLMPSSPGLQRALLEAEGVIFDAKGHCDLGIYQWSPRVARRAVIGSGGKRKPTTTKSQKKS
jgi:methylated-DNA-protein-cysteine methyltransferase related protein